MKTCGFGEQKKTKENKPVLHDVSHIRTTDFTQMLPQIGCDCYSKTIIVHSLSRYSTFTKSRTVGIRECFQIAADTFLEHLIAQK